LRGQTGSMSRVSPMTRNYSTANSCVTGILRKHAMFISFRYVAINATLLVTRLLFTCVSANTSSHFVIKCCSSVSSIEMIR